MATALYRRYRPETFSEMIGQAHVTEPLMTALRAGRIGHAYLFSGPRGCGKTTSARILARCLNCAEGPTDTPCGTCPSCVELSRDGGGSLDVVEIDAASHGGVDDARDLRERAVFAPARDRYKIFIIDEAHMVTAGGFNALLKIVEEPPPHVKFVFATTEPNKVIGTIRSRTHHYPFRLIAPGALIDYVQQLCDTEGVSVEPGVLPLVVRAGGGSVRDTLSILDQLIAGSEAGAVTLERATGLLGFTSTELLDEVVTALSSGDAAAAFAATDRVVQTGQDPRRFVEDLLERLRDLIVIGASSVQGASAVFRGVPADQLQRMFEQAQSFAPGHLSRLADTVGEALDRMTGATAPRLHLELMIARALVTAAPLRVSGQPSGPAAPAVATAPAGPAASAVAPASAAPAAPPAPSVPAAPVAPAAPATPSSAFDVVAAMKSAREFLNSDGAGARKPPIVPLGGHPSQAEPAREPQAQPAREPQTETSERAVPSTAGTPDPQPRAVDSAPAATAGRTPADPPASQPADPPASSTSESSAPSPAEPVGFAEIAGVWPELLEELRATEPEAWNAVRPVQPLAFDGSVLSVGLVSRADLDLFKRVGSGPLREAIEAALGVTVKYAPKQIPAVPAAAREHEAAPSDAEPSPRPSATSAAGPSSAPAARPHATPGARPTEFSEPPAPAWADPVPSVPDSSVPAPSGQAPAVPASSVPAPSGPASSVPAPSGPASSVLAEPKSDDREDPDAVYVEPTVDEDDPDDDPYRDARTPDADRPDAAPLASHPEASPAPRTDPATSRATTDPAPPTTDPAPPVASEPATGAAAHLPPKLQRYGEAVVREVLGARFIEERPLPRREE